MINYETLIKKYLKHVVTCEGISFMSYTDHETIKEFTNEERELLNALAKEAGCMHT